MRFLLLRAVPCALALHAATAGAQAFSTRDSLLVDAAAVPTVGTFRLSAGGGASAAPASASGSASGNLGASIQYTLLPGFALGLAGDFDGGRVSPAASMRYQFLSQAEHGLNLAALGRFKTVGFTPSAGEVEAGFSIGRRFGRFDLVGNGVAGKGVGSDTGTDLEGKLGAGFTIGQSGRIGADARLQAEVSDSTPATTPPVGRDFDLMAGPTASVILDRVQLQAFAGYAAPRHTFRTGPAALGLVSIDF